MAFAVALDAPPEPMRLPKRSDDLLWDAWLSGYRMPCLAAADELGVFDTLAAQPACAEAIAERFGLRLHALKALLPMLCALGFLSVRGGLYEPTPEARIYLLRGSPFYWGPALRLNRGFAKAVVAALRGLPTRAEKPGDAWATGELDLSRAQEVAAIMHSHALPAALALAQLPIWSSTKRLLDVGAGSGCFSIALARAHPRLRAILMDLPAPCVVADAYISRAGMGHAVQPRPTDMFREDWPAGHDAILFSNIFHDWDLETNAGLARRAFEAMAPGGRVYLHEMLITDDGSGPLIAAAFGVMMITGTEGRQYSGRELTEVLLAAGFTSIRITETYGCYSLVSGEKAEEPGASGR